MTPEEKVIEKLRKVLLADSTIIGYTKTRIYASHISSISEPKYPAISFHLLNSVEDISIKDYVSMSIQIDCWFQDSQYNMTDILTVHRRLRALLHRQNLTDTTISVKVASISEISAGPLMHEEENNLLHYPVRYGIIAS